MSSHLTWYLSKIRWYFVISQIMQDLSGEEGWYLLGFLKSPNIKAREIKMSWLVLLINFRSICVDRLLMRLAIWLWNVDFHRIMRHFHLEKCRNQVDCIFTIELKHQKEILNLRVPSIVTLVLSIANLFFTEEWFLRLAASGLQLESPGGIACPIVEGRAQV